MIRLRIKEVAEQKGLSMAKLARKADMDFKTVQRIFHDPYRDISMSTLDKLATALGIAANELIETVPDPNAQTNNGKPF